MGPNSTKIEVISGPSQSNGRFGPFNWKKWPTVSHEGMPENWNFDWVNYEIIDPERVLK